MGYEWSIILCNQQSQLRTLRCPLAHGTWLGTTTQWTFKRKNDLELENVTL